MKRIKTLIHCSTRFKINLTRFQNKRLHHSYKPAVIEYIYNEAIKHYFKHSYSFRENKPSIISRMGSVVIQEKRNNIHGYSTYFDCPIEKIEYNNSYYKPVRVEYRLGYLYTIEWDRPRNDKPSYIKYYKTGHLEIERYSNPLHRIDKPAVIIYYMNGNIQYQLWYRHGKLHRLKKPAFIVYYPNGVIQTEIYYVKNKLQQYKDNPSWIEYNSNGMVIAAYYINESYPCHYSAIDL